VLEHRLALLELDGVALAANGIERRHQLLGLLARCPLAVPWSRSEKR
jgi:hypothetical protein